jgi:hypothetical protein
MVANYKQVIVNASRGGVDVQDMSPAERQRYDADAARADAARQAGEAKAADIADAHAQIKAKAQNDQTMALIARALGIDLT